MSPAGPARRGTILAGLAALLFGVTAPLLKRASSDATVGPLAAGALLYLGAAAGAAPWALAGREGRAARALLSGRLLAS
ncbi:MAG TPA: EamA/RhaT family transporter, partial [Polyangia bacterium]|nr:EamA/RhaT family transporter [Polyangia bacterium]